MRTRGMLPIGADDDPSQTFPIVNLTLIATCIVVLDANSILPSLGASGAIAGALAAYLVLVPGNRVRVLIGYFHHGRVRGRDDRTPALIEFTNLFAARRVSAQTGGVASMAHIGLFVAGPILAVVLPPFADRAGGPHAVGYPRNGSES